MASLQELEKSFNDYKAQTDTLIKAMEETIETLNDKVQKIADEIPARPAPIKAAKKPQLIEDVVTIGKAKYKIKFPSWRTPEGIIKAEDIVKDKNALAAQLKSHPSVFEQVA